MTEEELTSLCLVEIHIENVKILSIRGYSLIRNDYRSYSGIIILIQLKII